MWLRGALLACISYLRETRVGNNSAWPATIGKATTNGFTDNRVSEGVPEHWVGGLTLNT